MEQELAVTRVTTGNGVLEGTSEAGVLSFKGVPFAAPPIGEGRWRPPQPVAGWHGVREAKAFGPRPMQLPVFGDMNFRSPGHSEDCLYLNVWTPDTAPPERLPVLLYLYGGGNVAGDGSEPRYDGAALARRGLVVVTANYRLNVFGFLAHPELSAEAPYGASGNYAYLDQAAALQWLHRNIASFGGDPTRITIAGESAGSVSVSAQMVSPLAKGLIAGAIGSSGSLLGTLAAVSLAEAEQRGLRIAAAAGAATLAMLRALPAERLLEATAGFGPFDFTAVVDGYFLPRPPAEAFAAGEQARVPLLLGWNSQELGYQAIMGQHEPNEQSFGALLAQLYGQRAAEALALYPASTAEQALQSATDLAGDRFTAYSTWKWSELHGTSSGRPVYRYLYAHPRPPMRPELGNVVAGLAGGVSTEPAAQPLPPARGAVHSAEIEYAMGNLESNTFYAWTPEDYAISELMKSCYANFVAAGDPNGPGVPHWPPANGGTPVSVMRFDVDTRVEPEAYRERYLFLDHE